MVDEFLKLLQPCSGLLAPGSGQLQGVHGKERFNRVSVYLSYMKRIVFLVLLTLGAIGCRKNESDVAPKPTPESSLLGQWRAGPEAYVYYNAQGAVTLTSSTRPNAPTTYLNISKTVWQNTASTPEDFLYSRADSIVTTLLLFNGAVINGNRYSITKLTDDRLILRWQVPLADGGRYVEKDYYSR